MEPNQEVLRSAAIQRIELAKLSQSLGCQPWTIVRNASYDAHPSPSVSVLITLFNYSSYIYECLDSVCASKTDHLPHGFEIIVVDDCSTDDSAQRAEDYLDKRADIPICLIKKTFNTGLADARNVALRVARAPYVFILDADNWIYPNCLSVLHREISTSNQAAVYGIINKFDNLTRESRGLMSYYEWDAYELISCPYIDAMAMLDREKLLSVGGYSTELIQHGWFGWEDYDVWLKLAQANYSCRLVPQILSAYRVHSQSMLNITNQYTPLLARYFEKKFSHLVSRFDHFNRLFGGPYPQSPSREDLENKIDHLEQQLHQIQSELQQSQNQLQKVQTKLASTSAQLQTKQDKLKAVRQTMQKLKHDLEAAQNRVFAMETSKFWKLRQRWFTLKTKLKFPTNNS